MCLLAELWIVLLSLFLNKQVENCSFKPFLHTNFISSPKLIHLSQWWVDHFMEFILRFQGAFAVLWFWILPRSYCTKFAFIYLMQSTSMFVAYWFLAVPFPRIYLISVSDFPLYSSYQWQYNHCSFWNWLDFLSLLFPMYMHLIFYSSLVNYSFKSLKL